MVNENHVNGSPDDLTDEPDFSDPEDYIDDVRDEDLLPELWRKRPKEQDGFDSVIVVDHIPQVGPDRIEKLKTVLKKFFSKFGKLVGEPHYPLDDKGYTRGYMFVEYANPDMAQEAVKAADGHHLDKQHVFAVNLFTEIEKYSNIEEDWEPPKPQPYKDRGNLRSWLLDPDCYDQYSVLHDEGKIVTIFKNATPDPIAVKERKAWTDAVVIWSPLGTYIATFHRKGIALWGGDEFNQIVKFSHEGVQYIDFSPCEKYLVTFSPILAANDHPEAIIVWDVRTGVKRRAFHSDQEKVNWPVFKWSPDDKYFARIGPDMLSIYETPSMALLEKKSMKIAGVKNFSWSPSQNILAYWVAENKDVPARVTLLEIPSKNELRAKNLFNVADCRMHWQKCGDYLCVKVDRYTKVRKEKNEVKYSGMFYNFEIFDMRKKDIPVASIEIKEGIVSFAWEPVGNKFAIIHGDGPQFYTVSFYGIKQGTTISLLKKFDNKQCNHLFWSPSGTFIVMASLRSMNHGLEWVDTSDNFSVTNTGEHFMATDVEWDPTGRYVATAVSWWAHKVDNAYWIWSFQGRLIRKHTLDKFCQLLWRPRPQTLLSEEKIREIKKNLKQYSAAFDIKDKMMMSKVSKDILEKRKRLMDEFKEYRERKQQEAKIRRQKLLQLRGIRDEKKEGDSEEIVEFLIREEKIELGPDD